MIEARRRAEAFEGDALLWRYGVADQQPLLVRVWNQRRAAEHDRDVALARAGKAEQDLAQLRVNAGRRLDEAEAKIAELTRERDEARTVLGAARSVLDTARGDVIGYMTVCGYPSWETTEKVAHIEAALAATGETRDGGRAGGAEG